jgi:hypothetical protein
MFILLSRSGCVVEEKCQANFIKGKPASAIIGFSENETLEK